MIENIAIVSLTSGTIGEEFVKHDIEIKRLSDLGMNVKFMPHTLNGIEYAQNYPTDCIVDVDNQVIRFKN